MLTFAAERDALVRACRVTGQRQLTPGCSGNLSVRVEDGYLITPSGARSDSLQPDALVFMPARDAPPKAVTPSSEWRFHRDIYAARTEVNAIVHGHPPFCTALACARRDIPAFHYMVAVAGGTDIRCAPYATFGTQELSDTALTALQDRRACLLSNHGMIAVGTGLEAAVALALEVENLAAQYWRALQVGKPKLLTDAQMKEVLRRFESYGAAR